VFKEGVIMSLIHRLVFLVGLFLTNTHHQVNSFGLSTNGTSNRRKWIASTFGTITSLAIQQQQPSTMTGLGPIPSLLKPPKAYADEDYDNPAMPDAPEERSGLMILRVAEVCDFQEKILRAVVNGDIETIIAPQQIVFGTQVLLRNSNLAGNMRLMIETEIPEDRRESAVLDAVKTMNTLQSISVTAAKVLRPFTKDEMIQIANLYRDVRLRLNNMYEYLPQYEKDKYYGYFMAVTEYEKKIAEGIYNPELDGVLKFDYSRNEDTASTN
jgi:hypothetical protein